MKKLALLLTLNLLIFISVFSQQSMPPNSYTSTNKKAIKHVQEGKHFYESRNDAEAEKSFNKALSEDPNFVEALMGLAAVSMAQNKNDQAADYLKKAIQINPKFFPGNFFQLGEIFWVIIHQPMQYLGIIKDLRYM